MLNGKETGRAAFYELLGRVRREGDWEAWLAFFLDGVRVTADGPTEGHSRCTNEVPGSLQPTVIMRCSYLLEPDSPVGGRCGFCESSEDGGCSDFISRMRPVR